MKQPVRRKLSIDRQINDTDIWVVAIAGKKRRYIGGVTGLRHAFDKDAGDYVCKVVMRFIGKRGDLVEHYE
jgi:hypothetical protein